MSLRARLTTAFLAMVLGPVLLGTAFVGVTVATLASERADDQLDAAVTAVRSTVSAACDRLAGAAGAVALAYGSGADAAQSTATRAVSGRQAAGVTVHDAEGESVVAVGEQPTESEEGADVAAAWCGRQAQSSADGADSWLSAEVPVSDDAGRQLGTAVAWQPVDADFVDELRSVAGDVDVVVDDGLAVESAEAASAADSAGAGESASRERAVPAEARAPLPLLFSVQERSPPGLYLVLFGLVAAAGVVAVVAATWMARSTTRPLSELAAGADALAKGDLSVRVQVRGEDELATLARTFNRMARETQGHVTALRSSRDQLRGQVEVLGETLSSTLDLDRILEVIVDTAMSATGAQSGVMLLTDPDDPEMLYVRACAGFAASDVVAGAQRVRLGEGILGGVAAQERVRIGRKASDAASEVGESAEATYLAVPVTALPETVAEADDDPDSLGRLLGVLAVYDRHGGERFNSADLSTLRTFAGQAAVAVGNVLTHHEAQRLSLTDPLTGLWNYRCLQVSLAREIERCGRFRRSAAVIAIDIDKFKIVNDTFGHQAGDCVLTELAERVRAEIRDVDMAFRYGGEEFVVLLPETDADGAIAVVGRLRQTVRGSATVLPVPGGRTQAVNVTVSLGVALYPEHGGDGPSVLAAADAALYAAKADGRDTWRVAELDNAER